MTSRPESESRGVVTSLSTSSPAPSTSPFADTLSRARLLRETNTIPSKSTAVDARPSNRPGLVSRASESSTKTIRPRHHLRIKSSSVIPTLSTPHVGTTPSSRSPTMTSSTGATSSGAADLLRQAMLQR
ncbi:uncharacterized protein K460DRAFT_185857 [Cucurbitaria berberidis CBS 394.84]|uniref:Uncharacterized protein n=1 Tax=Cucurbitaria berberidis CBS 394.84 TaxID=1168544 RepID=A0A9P4GBT3_9PLEO|nr:uncharacterized protein K460DRAFT_185857 [Cucurbitaria berberidis CBS 394.84]KAF1842471.1 hypothetical protein K460DRAFT_185857 [Cucurbitaria berberidis CBS 394.84]